MLHRAATALFCALLIGATPAGTPAQTLKVTLLGSGSPTPVPDRFGPSVLLEVGGEKLLFDVGRGASMRLWQSGVPLRDVSAVFFTHLHSDHVSGFPDLWLTSLVRNKWFGERTEGIRVFGPAGTKAMMTHLAQAYEADIRGRRIPPSAAQIVAADIRQGTVYERNAVEVTAFDVDHGALALGYRIDWAGHSVVLSGDTRVTENLVRFAKGTDVLFHEVAAGRPELLERSDVARRIISHHTTPDEAAGVFARVKPRLAVYMHIVLLATDSDISPPTIADIESASRTGYVLAEALQNLSELADRRAEQLVYRSEELIGDRDLQAGGDQDLRLARHQYEDRQLGGAGVPVRQLDQPGQPILGDVLRRDFEL
jgi:ribonuclease Z